MTEKDMSGSVDCSRPDYNISLALVLNQYNLEYEYKDAKKFLQAYIDKQGMAIDINSVPDGQIRPTMGWIADLLLKGCNISASHVDKLNAYINLLPSKVKKVVVKQSNKPSIQEAVQNSINEYLGTLEAVFDDLYTGKIKSFDIYSDMKAKQLPKQAVAIVQEWVKEKVKYFINVYESKDEQVIEAYAHKKKSFFKKMLQELASWISSSGTYNEYKKATRKPRKKKEKPASVQVAKLKYCKENTDLGIKSINPADMIGCGQLLCYNVKTRKVILFRTDSASGIKCKGSSLLNYEPELSMQKTLRKPKEQLTELMSLSKVQMRKFIENIKAKAAAVKSRINADTMILRAIK
jgi:hypothetical protein